MDQLCAVAEVSKRTLYQRFPGKDALIAEHLRRFDPDILPEMFDRADLTPRERLLAALDIHPPLCPFIAAAVEIHDPGQPARVHARDYKQALAARLTETARRPAPPTPNSSASNWRCSWMAPRPAAESSTPQPSPPPPPSQRSSSTTPSPRQRGLPEQTGTCQPGRGRVPDAAASSAEVDAKGQVEAPHAIAAQAHRQQARSLQPVRHGQVAGVPRAQSEAGST
jgi:hypothetical protein